MKAIKEFRGKYFFLSNFYNTKIEYFDMVFENNEAAFQSMKCPERMEEFTKLSAAEAKRLGRRVPLCDDWEESKETIMYEICLAKFTQHKDLEINFSPRAMPNLLKAIPGTTPSGASVTA